MTRTAMALLLLAMIAAVPAGAGEVRLEGDLVQGGLVLGTAKPGARVALDGRSLRVGTDGGFVFGLGRDAGKRAQNIETANAVEALACWLVLSRNNWVGDRRLRGGTKMRHRRDVSFAEARKRNFYVTQPMRMSTVQPLHALGLVHSESERFNAFSTAQPGLDFIAAVCDASGASYRQRNVLDHLVGWA